MLIIGKQTVLFTCVYVGGIKHARKIKERGAEISILPFWNFAMIQKSNGLTLILNLLGSICVSSCAWNREVFRIVAYLAFASTVHM